ncbi:porin family protein [Flavobacterium urumqiense]|uniref:Outer membrane protein beta-barrel domain-containing protein n=1 Tax=Flavobacterium urumqiense TaxID=935224 RepID=A0A1H5YQN6_9FLAO|nr:porin family protein [Flavobacterium urumqiense]SEG26032.1 Outer membrane protein beta-barrel domain-containing protein [Flavobacterium urumqiense]
MKNSRKIILASLLLTFISYTNSNAQSNVAKFGVKGGVNFSNLYTDNADDENVLTGFNIGLYAKVPVTNSISIQPEVYYTGKGAEVVYNNVFASGTAKFKLNYIEVPVMLVANVTKNFNVQVGPYAGYLISGKTTNESGTYNFQDNINTDDFNKIDAGVAAGLGFDLETVSFGVRYNYGLTKVGKERNYSGTNYTFPDGKNSVLSFYGAFSFN